jgi:hypothetical protein
MYGIHGPGFENEETVQTVRISPTMTVAKARALHNEGWQVHIIDAHGKRFEAAEECRRALQEQRRPIRFDTSCANSGCEYGTVSHDGCWLSDPKPRGS